MKRDINPQPAKPKPIKIIKEKVNRNEIIKCNDCDEHMTKGYFLQFHQHTNKHIKNALKIKNNID